MIDPSEARSIYPFQLRYEPFPMGVASPFLEEALYKELVARFPSVDLFKEIPGAAPPSDLQGRRVDVRAPP